LGVRERDQLVEGTALLERIGDLQVLVFDVHRGPGERRELGRRQHRGARHLAGDGAAGGLDVRKRDAHSLASSLCLRPHEVARGPVPLVPEQSTLHLLTDSTEASAPLPKFVPSRRTRYTNFGSDGALATL